MKQSARSGAAAAARWRQRCIVMPPPDLPLILNAGARRWMHAVASLIRSCRSMRDAAGGDYHGDTTAARCALSPKSDT
jgi:hypothetical protein